MTLFLPFPQPQLVATFLGRPQRFLAEMSFSDGTRTLAYCANPGSLKGCLLSGSPALLWDSGDVKRKRRYTWRGIKLDGIWVGTDTHLANRIVAELIQQKLLKCLNGYQLVERETRVEPGLRMDFLLEGARGSFFVEVKNAVVAENRVARFPDSITPRGLKHLEGLTRKALEGHRALLLFVVQRGDVDSFTISSTYHPAYAATLCKALAAGVEMIAVALPVSPEGFGKPRLLPLS